MTNGITDEQRDEILDAIRSGQKILAIKQYRDATDCGLKEAKDFVEAVTDEMRERDPDSVPASFSGCAGSVALMVLVVVAIFCF